MIDTYLAVSWQSQFFSIHQTRPSVCSSLVTIQQRVPAAHCRGKYISFPHQTQKNRGQKLLCGGVKFSAIVRRRYGTPHTSVTSANTMLLDCYIWERKLKWHVFCTLGPNKFPNLGVEFSIEGSTDFKSCYSFINVKSFGTFNISKKTAVPVQNCSQIRKHVNSKACFRFQNHTPMGEFFRVKV